MARPPTIKIDVTKIDKSLLYVGKKGTYLSIALFPNTRPSEYGDTHFVAQEASKEQREAGVKGPIIGNATIPDGNPPPQQAAQARKQQQPAQVESSPSETDGDDIPFAAPHYLTVGGW